MSNSTITHIELFKLMEKWAPKHLAYDWDPIGLQVGSFTDITHNVLVSLDVTEAVVEEAIEKNANLIIAHHPLLFKPLSSLNTTTQKGKIIRKLIQHNITVYAAHTNLDNASGGVNDMLAEQLRLKYTSVFIQEYSDKLLKLAVFVPVEHVDSVKEALGNVGAGFIGNYSHCSFQTAGTGSFKPLEGTDPFIGNKNEQTYVQEEKIETIIKSEDQDDIINALVKAHPYEEVAYDLYPVIQTGNKYGLGRIGYLTEQITLQSFCEHIKDVFHVKHLRYVGNPTKLIKKVAIIGGSGEKYIPDALKHNVDVFITGDVSFHPAQDALEMGLSMIDPGHYIEEIMKQKTKEYLSENVADINIFASNTITDPFQFM